LLERPIRVLVVGCGGDGKCSALRAAIPSPGAPRIRPPQGLDVTAIDPETVTETNCVREPFCRTEIGLPKVVVLVHRINLFWGLTWRGMPLEIQHLTKGTAVDVVIGCVDTRKARRAIHAWVQKSPGSVLGGFGEQWGDGTIRPGSTGSTRQLPESKEKVSVADCRGALPGNRCHGRKR
jgi:hypothetical protein